MPRIYLTPTELTELPLGIGLSSTLANLNVGVLDKMLARASVRCDHYCQKRLQAPGSTTLTADVATGDTSLTLASTLTLDQDAEQAVLLNPGGATQEIVAVQPGGVTVTNWTIPYPGTVSLATGCTYAHSSGEPVSLLYQEISESGGSSSSDPYTEALSTQAMQLALAHLPPAHTALTRVVFTKAYPIIQVVAIEHAFSFVNQFNAIDLSIESIVPTEGWIRFNVGTVVLREGLMRLTYTAGYQSIPDDIKTACAHFVADELMQLSNPFMATALTLGKRSQRWDVRNGRTPNAEMAMGLLNPYRRKV